MSRVGVFVDDVGRRDVDVLRLGRTSVPSAVGFLGIKSANLGKKICYT